MDVLLLACWSSSSCDYLQWQFTNSSQQRQKFSAWHLQLLWCFKYSFAILITGGGGRILLGLQGVRHSSPQTKFHTLDWTIFILNYPQPDYPRTGVFTRAIFVIKVSEVRFFKVRLFFFFSLTSLNFNISCRRSNRGTRFVTWCGVGVGVI